MSNPPNHWPAQAKPQPNTHLTAHPNQDPSKWPAQTKRTMNLKKAQHWSAKMKQMYQSGVMSMFDPNLVTELSDTTIMDMIQYETSLVLFYDSGDDYCELLVTLIEQLATLVMFESLPVSVGALDAAEYLDTVLNFTDRLPTLCLFLGGVPIIYTSLFNVGDIHTWLKGQLYTNCCPVSYSYPQMPTPTPTP